MNQVTLFALTVAAHKFVAIENSEQHSIELYHRLKDIAADDDQGLVMSLSGEPIPGDYEDMTVLELVELIEHEAEQLLLFSNRMFEAAQLQIMVEVTNKTIHPNLCEWKLSDMAEAYLDNGGKA
jgi:hypothetical protein